MGYKESFRQPSMQETTRKIRIKKFPKESTDFLGNVQVFTVGEIEIKWDTRICAWESSLQGIGKMRSYLIGRIVDGEVLITENVLHDQPAQGQQAAQVKAVFEELLAAGEDLGEWE